MHVLFQDNCTVYGIIIRLSFSCVHMIIYIYIYTYQCRVDYIYLYIIFSREIKTKKKKTTTTRICFISYRVLYNCKYKKKKANSIRRHSISPSAYYSVILVLTVEIFFFFLIFVSFHRIFKQSRYRLLSSIYLVW